MTLPIGIPKGSQRFGLLGGTLCALAGCGSHMAVPANFGSDSITFETDGRSGDDSEGDAASFEIGSFDVHAVKRGLTFKRGFENLDGFEPAKNRGYRFKLTARGNGALEFFGQCADRAAKTIEEVDGSITKIEDNAALGCTCQEPGTDETRFYVEAPSGSYEGPISVAGVGAKLVGVYETDDGDEVEGQPVGFRVEDEGGAVAAADILPGDAKIWLKRDMAEADQGRLLCALVGILLWVPPRWPSPPEETADEDSTGEDSADADEEALGGSE